MILVAIVTLLTVATIGFVANKFSKANQDDTLMNVRLPPSINPPEHVWAGDPSADLFSCILLGFKNTEVLWDPRHGGCTLRTIDARGYPISVKLSPTQVREIISVGRTGYHLDGQRVVDALCTILKQRAYITVEFVEATGEGQGLSAEVLADGFLLVDIT